MTSLHHRFLFPILLIGGTLTCSHSYSQGVNGELPPKMGIEDLIEQLKAEKFELREKAELAVWTRGEEAVIELRSAMKSNDPELRFRATEIYEYIQAGIFPNTPKRILKLIEQVREAKTVDSVDEPLSELMSELAYRQIIYLYRVHTQPSVKQHLLGYASKVAPIVARGFVKKGDFEGADSVLRQLPIQGEVSKALVALYVHQGKMDQLIQEAKLGGDSTALLVADCYTVNRQYDKLLAWSQGEANRAVEAKADFLNGRPQMLTKQIQTAHYASENNNRQLRDQSSQKLGYAIADALAAGDLKRADALRYDLKKAVTGSTNVPKIVNQQIGMLSNGYSVSFEQSMKQFYIAFRDKEFRKQINRYFQNCERPDVLLKTLDAPLDRKELKNWAVKVAREAQTRDPKRPFSGSGGVDMRRLFVAAELFHERHEKDTVRSILDPVFDGAQKYYAKNKVDPEQNRYHQCLGQAVYLGMGWYVQERLAGLSAEDVEGVFQRCFGSVDYVKLLWPHLTQKKADGDSLEKAFLLTGVLRSSDKFKTEVLHAELLKIAKAMKGDNSLMDALYAAAEKRGDVQFITEYVKQQLGDDLDDENQMIYRSILFETGQWKELAAIFAKFEAKGGLDPEHYSEWAIALEKMGQKDAAAEKFELFELYAMGELRFYYTAAVALVSNGLHERALVYFERVLAEAESASSFFFSTLQYLNQYYPLYCHKGDWAMAHSAAVTYKYVAMTYNYSLLRRSNGRLGSFIFSPSEYIQISNHADFTHGMAVMKDDPKLGEALLNRCVDTSRGGGSLAEAFFPALKKAGYHTISKRAYQKVSQQYDEVLKRYPRSANTCNSYAWLAAKAAMDLQKAEKLSVKSLELAPYTATYMDTLAEVYFAQKKRGKAIDISKKAVAEALLPRSEASSSVTVAIRRNALLRQQLEHFEKDPFP